jgi:hypothetical protein
MRLRRYFPLLGAVAFIAICVFLGRSEKLMSEAGAVAGCGGSAGVAQDISGLGTIDDQTRSEVAELARLPILGQEAGELNDEKTIERLNAALTRNVIGAAPALAEKFQNDGCFLPGSARIADLIGQIGTSDKLSAAQRQIFVNVLLNTATFVASQVPESKFKLQQNGATLGQLRLRPTIAANPRLELAFKDIRAAIQENNVDGIRDSVSEIAQSEKPKLDSEKLDQFNQQTCSIRAFDAVAAIVQHKLEDPEKTAYRIFESLEALQALDKGAYKLVKALAQVAPAIKPWDAHFLSIAMNKNFDDDTRGLACKNAATRGNDLSAIRKIEADVKLPPQIADCLLSYQKEGPAATDSETPKLDVTSIPSIYLDRRIDVIRATPVVSDQAAIILKVQNLFDPSNLINFSNLGTLQGLSSSGVGLRERLVLTGLVATAIAQAPFQSRTSILDEVKNLEALSPANHAVGMHLRGLVARRTGPSQIAAEIDNIQKADNPNVIERDISDKKPMNLEKAVQEIQRNTNSQGINSLNPVDKQKKDDGEEEQNGAPIKLPKLGQ